MRKYLLASAAAAAIAVGATGAHAQSAPSVAPGTTQNPQAVTVVNTGDFTLNVGGRMDMFLYYEQLPAGSGQPATAAETATPSGSTYRLYAGSENDYYSPLLYVNADYKFAPGQDLYAYFEQDLFLGTGIVSGEGSSTQYLPTAGNPIAINSDQMWNRQAYTKYTYAGVGSITWGRIYSTVHAGTGHPLSFAYTTAGGGLSSGAELYNTVVRTNNTVLLQSPNLNGFYVDLGTYNMGFAHSSTAYSGNAAAGLNNITPGQANLLAGGWLDQGGMEGDVTYSSPDGRLNLTADFINYISDASTLGASSSSFSIATGGTGLYGGSTSGTPWLTQLGGYYNFGPVWLYGYLSLEQGQSMGGATYAVGSTWYTSQAGPTAANGFTGTHSNEYVAAVGVALPFGAQLIAPAQYVGEVRQQKVILDLSEAVENTSVTQCSTLSAATAAGSCTAAGATGVSTVKPTAYKLGFEYYYFFTPAVSFEFDAGYVWNKNGAFAAVPGGAVQEIGVGGGGAGANATVPAATPLGGSPNMFGAMVGWAWYF